MSITEAALLREVARVQNDKTLQAIRDLVDSLPITKQSARSYGQEDLTARYFRAELVKRLRDMQVES